MSKRIVVCCDGTWNKFEKGNPENTNVGRFSKHLIDNAAAGQVVKYNAGVGTGMAKYIGGLTGYGVSENIRQMYEYLAQTYETGDQIFLFGFSRGAYTVRSLAGMLHQVGLVHRENRDHVKSAFDVYRHGSKQDKALFAETKGRMVDIAMIGVWDTVGALGIPISAFNPFKKAFHQFHDTELNAKIKHAYHAVAIDERRKPFAPTLWKKPEPGSDQKIEEVWFAGVHSDVGGGYTERGLADITLNWMMKKGRKHGLVFNSAISDEVSPDPAGVLHDSRKGWFGKIAYRSLVRNIPVDGSTSVARSVLRRMLASKLQPQGEYRPENLSGPQELAARYQVVPVLSLVNGTDRIAVAAGVPLPEVA